MCIGSAQECSCVMNHLWNPRKHTRWMVSVSCTDLHTLHDVPHTAYLKLCRWNILSTICHQYFLEWISVNGNICTYIDTAVACSLRCLVGWSLSVQHNCQCTMMPALFISLPNMLHHNACLLPVRCVQSSSASNDTYGDRWESRLWGSVKSGLILSPYWSDLAGLCTLTSDWSSLNGMHGGGFHVGPQQQRAGQ